MNKSKDGEVNAHDVGRHFLTKYYNAMAHDVDQVVHFYSDSSNLKRFGKPPVSGLENIKIELNKHRMDNMSVRIFSTICLNSLSDSIIIQVSGEFVQKDGDARAFIQNVILASQGPGKYYIYSDMIEWLAELYPNLNANLQNLSLSSVPEPTHHYNGQTNKHPEPLVHHQEQLFSAHSPDVYQNGQVQQQIHHPELQNVIEQQQPQQTFGHHQGAPVRNIQSFINQAATEPQKQEPQQQTFKPTPLKEFSTERQSQPKSENTQSSSSIPQQQPLQTMQIPEDSGPRTWAKLVSGQIKSNGLPPPTQPPPVVEPFQTMDKKIKTQQEFQQNRGGQQRDGNFKHNRDNREGGNRDREGGNREGGNRDREGGNREGGNRDRDGNREKGDRPFRPRRQQGEGQEGGKESGERRPFRRNNNNENREGGERKEGGQRTYNKQGSFNRGQNNAGGERPYRQNAPTAGPART